MGENGAGKSTLLKILSGFRRHPQGGEAGGTGRKCSKTRSMPFESGIAIIYQELHLVPSK